MSGRLKTLQGTTHAAKQVTEGEFWHRQGCIPLAMEPRLESSTSDQYS